MKKGVNDFYQRKLDYNNAYNRKNYRSFSIRYNNLSEKKIISWLEKQPSVKGYVTLLIAKDMEKHHKNAKLGRTTRSAKKKR